MRSPANLGRNGMSRNRNRWLFRLAILLVAGVIFFLWVVQGQSQQLTVENQSGQRIARLQITIAGQTHTFRDVKAGEKVSASFRFKSDDHFQIEGELADKTTIRSSGAIGDRVLLVVQRGGELQFRPSGKG
jgi:hypothetical protein